MPRIAKTIFHMEVDNKEYHVSYNGSLTIPETKVQLKHNERLMRALAADDQLLTFFYNIVMPVVRYKRRQARKQKKAGSSRG